MFTIFQLFQKRPLVFLLLEHPQPFYSPGQLMCRMSHILGLSSYFLMIKFRLNGFVFFFFWQEYPLGGVMYAASYQKAFNAVLSLFLWH